MLFPRKAYKHKMPAWVWICTLHGCPPHHVLTNLSLSMYHKQPRRIDWYGLDTKKKIIFANVSYKSTVLNLDKAGFGVNGFQPHKLVMGGSNSVHQCLQEGIVDCVPVLPTPLVGGCGSKQDRQTSWMGSCPPLGSSLNTSTTCRPQQPYKWFHYFRILSK